MKGRYLVVHDYGTGGVWLYVLANSRADIDAMFPELRIVDELPEWMPGDLRERLESSVEDIDEPGPKLTAIIEERRT
jgi:hypothetical protein